MRKPVWLDKKIDLKVCHTIKGVLRSLRLNTVCEEALCPNISECFGASVATFLILGNTCTRNCSFCGISKGTPEAVDDSEPFRISEAVKLLDLDYIVITSPARDDLKDGGASLFCQTTQKIKNIRSNIRVELLIPDFLGSHEPLEKIAFSGADVVAHNIETVPSLYIKVRRDADYHRSLKVIKLIKSINKRVFTKSGLMLGLGEKNSDVIKVFKDLRRGGCDFLTLGQYLPPSPKHTPLQRYINPDIFRRLARVALKLGFLEVKSSPYTRSSYLAHSFLQQSYKK